MIFTLRARPILKLLVRLLPEVLHLVQLLLLIIEIMAFKVIKKQEEGGGTEQKCYSTILVAYFEVLLYVSHI